MTDSLQVLDKMRVSASTNPNHDPDGDSRPLAREGSSDLLGGWFLRRIWRFPSNRSYLGLCWFSLKWRAGVPG